MRKTLWIILIGLLVAIGAPTAQADSFTYSFTEVFFGVTQFSWTTDPIPVASTSTTVLASGLSSAYVNPSGSLGGSTITEVILNTGLNETNTFFRPFDEATAGYNASQYVTPGIYAEPCGGATCTLTVTEVSTTTPTPESGTKFLITAGAGMLGLMSLFRKR